MKEIGGNCTMLNIVEMIDKACQGVNVLKKIVVTNGKTEKDVNMPEPT